jgi:hypothetical protein
MSAPTPVAFAAIRPGRLWNLWDMINFKIGQVNAVLAGLNFLINMGITNGDAVAKLPGAHKAPELQTDARYLTILAETKDAVTRIIDQARPVLSPFKCPHIDHAIDSLGWWLNTDNPSWGDLRMKAIALRNAIQTELKQYYYYQYPRQKAEVLRSWKDDWKSAICAFPAIEREAFLATDAYALGHDVAAVFYSMRILEIGLKALAADVGLTFDLQQWHNIIDQIESRISEERRTLPRGSARNERLQFNSEAAKEFFYFKEGWRNHVSHNRADYDEHQALSVLIHVRAFMNHLASKFLEAEQ